MRDQLIEKLPDVELKKTLLEVSDVTLEASMEKVRKWKASREQASQIVTNMEQALMQLKKVLDVEPKEKVFVSTVVKKVTLLKVKIVQPGVGKPSRCCS